MNFEKPIKNQKENKNILRNDSKTSPVPETNKEKELGEINNLKKDDYEKSQEQLKKIRESISTKELESKKIEGFDKAYILVEKEIDKILIEKERALISLAGKSGSGKTFFSEGLKNKLIEKGKTVVMISSDNFYKEHRGVEDKEIDVEKLQNEIRKAQKEFEVVIVEGFQIIDNNILGQKPDFKTFISSDFKKRLATKLDRDSRTFRSIEDSLNLIVEAFVYNPEIAKKFEGDIDISDVDLEIINNYKNLNDPKLYIQNNELVFSSIYETKKRKLNNEELRILKKIGIEIL